MKSRRMTVLSKGLVSLASVALVSCVGTPSAPPGGAAGHIEAIYRLGLGPGDLLLEGLLEFIEEHDIKDGAVLTGIGSLSECSLHWPTKVAYPSTNRFETFKGPLEIGSLQGIIADGEPHLHMMIAEGGDVRAAGGHVEKGCKVLYLAELTIAKFGGPAMTRRPNQHGVNMLQAK